MPNCGQALSEEMLQINETIVATLDISIKRIVAIDDISMSYTVDAYYTTTWNIHEANDKAWEPDLYFPHSIGTIA